MTGVLALTLVWQGAALPVEVKTGSTLRVSSQGETLFEVSPVEGGQLKTLKAWLANPPQGVKISAEGSFLVGLPEKLTVTQEIAKRWKSEPKSLAKLFATRLNAVLGDGKPSWSVSGQVVPLSESRIVRLSPFRDRDELTVRIDNPEIATVDNLGAGRYRLSGKSTGRASLLVESGAGAGVSIPSLPINVKPWAARWGSGPPVFTFWGPVDQTRLERKLRRWLSARTLVGAAINLQRVESEEGRTYKVRATAPGALSVEKTFPLEHSQYSEQSFSGAKNVVLSNHPERIVSDGVLFDRLVQSTPFRFMWHHRNDPEGQDRYLVLQLHNPTSVTRRFRMLWFSYGPSPDEIHVGHTAALDFASAAIRQLGEEVVLPANGSRTLEIRHVKAGQTMSGMAYLADLNRGDGPVGVKVIATSGGGPLPTYEAESRDPGRTASGVFPASIETQATHVLGAAFTYLEFGGDPYESDVEQGHPSYGNFGTVYRTRLMLVNPSEETKQAYFGFASGGGAARGVLSLDGELYDLPMGLTGDGIPVTSYTLQAGERRQVDVELFPQAGSNYPVRLVVRSDFERRESSEAEPLRPLTVHIP